MKWEYVSKRVYTPEVEIELNSFAEHGWEFVSAVAADTGINGTSLQLVLLIFKRPKQ